jgi:Arc/MetJ family transcription regulator
MRTNIDINDDLMAKAMLATGLKTKKAVIEKTLNDVYYYFLIQEMESLRRPNTWKGDLEMMRTQDVTEI